MNENLWLEKWRHILPEQSFKLRIQTWVWPQSPRVWTASYGLRFSSSGCGSWVEPCWFSRVFCVWVYFFCPHLSWSLGLTFSTALWCHGLAITELLQSISETEFIDFSPNLLLCDPCDISWEHHLLLQSVVQAQGSLLLPQFIPFSPAMIISWLGRAVACAVSITVLLPGSASASSVYQKCSIALEREIATHSSILAGKFHG